MGLVALTFLSEDVQAAKAKYRPTPGSTPWYKMAKESTWEKPDWNVNYPVPNFGQDTDIKASLKHTATAEADLGHKMQSTFKKPKGPPMDYFVPNFGPDADVKLTQDHITETESDLGHKWTPDLSKPKGPPQNYYVPNFGADEDNVLTTKQSLAAAEASTGHKWNYVAPTDAEKAGHPQNYYVPNFGMDQEIVDAQANIAHQEKTHGPWTPKQDDNGVWIVPGAADNNSYTYKSSLVQLDSESDPICSSAGCNYASEKGAKTHPMNYFVPHFGRDHDLNITDNSLDWAEKNLGRKWNWTKPAKDTTPRDYPVANFGVDHDIAATQASIATQEALHGKWHPVQDDNGVWILPQAADNKSYTYNANVQLEAESDPICSSAGCNHASEKKSGHPMNYFVPHFGRDHDMNGTDVSLDWAEKSLGRKWNWVKPAKGKDSDFRVPDFGLEEDIVGTQANIAAQEKTHGPWVVKQDENGVW